MRNARPGLEDRLFAAGITGRKAGEVCTVNRGLFVPLEERLQTLSCGGLYCACFPTTNLDSGCSKDGAEGQGHPGYAWSKREDDRQSPWVILGSLLKPSASVSLSVKQRD